MSNDKDKTTAPPPAGKTLAKMQGGAPVQAIIPTSLGEVFALAEMIFKAGLAPNSVSTPQALTIILMKGMELGLGPMAAMDCISVINGKACLHSDGIPALLWSHGFRIEEHYTGETLDTLVAHCKITRPDGTEYTFSYGAADAKENGLWDERAKDSKGNPNKSPWFKFRRRMLKMRCRGWLARDCASDVLKGMPIWEEQRDIELGSEEYREVKQAALAVPDDIEEPAPAVSEAEDTQEGLIANEDQYLERYREQLEVAETRELYDEVVAAHQELVEAGRISRNGQLKADAINEACAKRFG